MRSSAICLASALTLFACSRQRDVSLELVNFDGELTAYVYEGHLGCEERDDYIESGVPQGGSVASFRVGAAARSPDLDEGPYTIVVVGVNDCQVSTVGCTELRLPEDRRVGVDAFLPRAPTAWCEDEGCCGGVEPDAGGTDAGAAGCALGGDGAECVDDRGVRGNCCGGLCTQTGCCMGHGDDCTQVGGEGVCCGLDAAPQCLPYADCSCEGRDDTPCEDAGAMGVCRESACDTSPSASCTPPLRPMSGACELSVTGRNAPAMATGVDVLFYQLDAMAPSEVFLGQAQRYAPGAAHRFLFDDAPPDSTLVCSRMTGCAMTPCPCDLGAGPALGFGAVVAGDLRTMSGLGGWFEAGQELVIVWANENLDPTALAADPAFMRFGFDSTVVFEGTIPAGYTAWLPIAEMGGVVRLLPHGDPDPVVTFGCCLPLPPR